MDCACCSIWNHLIDSLSSRVAKTWISHWTFLWFIMGLGILCLLSSRLARHGIHLFSSRTPKISTSWNWRKRIIVDGHERTTRRESVIHCWQDTWNSRDSLRDHFLRMSFFGANQRAYCGSIIAWFYISSMELGSFQYHEHCWHLDRFHIRLHSRSSSLHQICKQELFRKRFQCYLHSINMEMITW